MERERIMQTGTHPAADAAPLPRGELFLSPPRRGGRRPGWVVPFIRCQRAAATALTAAVMTIMSVAGFAFTSDHTHLVYQRDILKAGTDAATLATTRHLWTLDENLSTEQVKTALMPIARRYILANIPESRRERATETLTITLTPDRSAGTVDIVAQADLGGIIFGSWMYGDVVSATRVDSLSDLELADGTTDEQESLGTPMTEVALAIDITGSMGYPLPDGDTTKIEIVKNAAQTLVDTITADTSRTVAIGLVPWHYRVRFDNGTRTRWEDNGWAQYPARRYYPNPHWESWKKIPRNSNRGWFPDPHLVTAAGEWHDVPAKGNKRWEGCVDQRRLSGDDPPGFSAALPTVTPFTMGFYSPTVAYPRDSSISLQCDQTDPISNRPSGKKDECFTGSGHAATYRQWSSQFNCSVQEIMPLTTDVAKIKRKISGLGAGGSATYSTLGVVWGHRLLAPAWRTIWGDTVHPVNAASNVRKVLVLLTDGDDNHLDQNVVWAHRRQACTAAKNAGIEIITVFAGDPSRGLKDELLACASPVGDDADEDDTNSFTGETEEDLEGAFEEIGERLRPLRLMR